MNKRLYIFIFSALFLLLFLQSCKQGKEEHIEDFSVSLRIPRDPATLNPIKSAGTVESDITQYLFLPLADYDPFTLQLIPVMIEAMPVGVKIDTGYWAGTLRFDCLIRKEAVWDDGSPVTAYDYLFTIKTIKHPGIQANPALKSIFKVMRDIEISPDDPQRFFIYVEGDYALAKELALIVPVYPEYLYDAAKALRAYTLDNAELKPEKPLQPAQDSMVNKFVEEFNHINCGRILANGANAYELAAWQTNQYIVLKKKSNWWGDQIRHNPYFQAYPSEIRLEVIPDPNTAFMAFKSGKLDLLDQLDGLSFSRLKEEDPGQIIYGFDSPGRLMYYFLGLNNHSPVLKDKNIRKALACLLDIDLFIKNFESGNGIRLNTPVLPGRSYYHNDLKAKSYDPDKAESLIKNAGWIDTNNNGIADKIIGGKRIELKLEILISGNELGKNLALVLQQNAKEAGIQIDIVTKDPKLIPQEIAARNFDIYPTGVQYGLYPEDLYQSWHSSNDFPGGSNRFGFNNKEADRLLEALRETRQTDESQKLLRQIQEIIYEEQPVVFLYIPTNNIVFRKNLDIRTSIKPPGFFINTIKPLARKGNNE